MAAQYIYQQMMPALSVDVVMLYASTKNVYVALRARDQDPYKDCYEIPGDFLLPMERIVQAAVRIIEEKCFITDLSETPRYVCYLDNPQRDSRCRVISYVMYLQIQNKPENKPDNVIQWFNVKALPAMAFDHELAIKESYDLMKKLKEFERRKT